MFPTLMLCGFAGVSLPEEVVDRMVSTRTVVVQRQVMLRFAVLTGDPLGDRESGMVKSLAEPTLAALHKQTATFMMGREGEGVQIVATPQIQLDGNIRLACATTVSTPKVHSSIQLSGGQFVEGVDSKCHQMTVELKPGHRIKVRLSAKSATDQTWMELTANVVDSPLVTPPPALVPPPAVAASVIQATYKVPAASHPQTVCPEAALFPTPRVFPVPATMPTVVPAGGVSK